MVQYTSISVALQLGNLGDLASHGFATGPHSPSKVASSGEILWLEFRSCDISARIMLSSSKLGLICIGDEHKELVVFYYYALW